MAEIAYRLLAALLSARRPLVAILAIGATVLWLVLLRDVARAPSVEGWLVVAAVPGLLALAAWSLFQLPPGVVFRAAPAIVDPTPQRTARCLASAYFESLRRAEWRLLARSSVAIGPDGSVALASPPPILAAPEEARQAFPSRGQPTVAQLRAGERPRHPEWVYQPETLVGGPSRLVYQSAADYAEAVGKLAIPRACLVDVTAGWQYAGFGRWPAIRLSYRDADGALATAYLAFLHGGQRAWALARLVGRAEPPPP